MLELFGERNEAPILLADAQLVAVNLPVRASGTNDVVAADSELDYLPGLEGRMYRTSHANEITYM